MFRSGIRIDDFDGCLRKVEGLLSERGGNQLRVDPVSFRLNNAQNWLSIYLRKELPKFLIQSMVQPVILEFAPKG